MHANIWRMSGTVWNIFSLSLILRCGFGHVAGTEWTADVNSLKAHINSTPPVYILLRINEELSFA